MPRRRAQFMSPESTGPLPGLAERCPRLGITPFLPGVGQDGSEGRHEIAGEEKS